MYRDPHVHVNVFVYKRTSAVYRSEASSKKVYIEFLLPLTHGTYLSGYLIRVRARPYQFFSSM